MPKKQPELIDAVAEYLNMDIVDREAMTAAVNEILANMITPRLYGYELTKRGIISPKKASDDARGTREVKHG